MKDGKMQSKGGEINGEGEEAGEREERERKKVISLSTAHIAANIKDIKSANSDTKINSIILNN